MRKENHRVGFGSPPKASRFRKGVSGNPRGRPKGSRNLQTDLEAELRERIAVTAGGRAQKLSKQQALIKSLMARAVNGDGRAASTILNLILKLIDPVSVPAGEETRAERDRQIIDGFLARHMGGCEKKESNDEQ